MALTLTSASTDAEVEAVYDDNNSYSDGSGNVAMAQQFKQAAKMLLRRYPNQAAQDGTSIGRNTAGIKAELDAVEDWLQANDVNQNGGNVIITDTRLARCPYG